MKSMIRIIVNSAAGYKAGLTTNQAGLATVEAAVKALNLPAEIVTTSGPGDATRLARQAVEAGQRLIVAAGGDGTVREVAAGLIDQDVTLGILPLGSAMNIARLLDIPRDVMAAMTLIRDAERRAQIDVGQIDGHRFLEVAGAGITAGLLHLLGEIDSGRWRRLRTLLRYLRLVRPHWIRLEWDGQLLERRTFGVLVANAPLTGVGLSVAPQAILDDGLLDISVFLTGSKWALARYWLRLLSGRPLQAAEVVTFTTAQLTVHARRRVAVHADDVLIGTTPVTLKVLPQAVAVFVGPQPSGLSAMPSDRATVG